MSMIGDPLHRNPVIAAEMAGHYIRTTKDEPDVCRACGTEWKCAVILAAEHAARERNRHFRPRLHNDPAGLNYDLKG